MNDTFGTPLSVGDIVVQNVNRGALRLREVIEINPEQHPNKVRLGESLRQSWRTSPSWVSTDNVAKYFNQEVSQ